MENKLEQLLNSLIEKGWLPRNKKPVNVNNKIKSQTYCKYFSKYTILFHREDTSEEDIKRPRKSDEHSLRELVSKESWLWQFVCENGMIENPREDFRWTNDFQLDYIEFNETDFQYWLMESSLKDESELEDFLLSNIKVDVKGD